MWPHALHAQLFAKTMRWHQIERKKKKKRQKNGRSSACLVGLLQSSNCFREMLRTAIPPDPAAERWDIVKMWQSKKTWGQRDNIGAETLMHDTSLRTFGCYP